jgi:peptide/nickel transport system substrate-binding protein
MKRREWLSLVLSSGLWARPRYGGVLRFFPTLPPVDQEPLSRLAASAIPDSDRRTWRLSLRPYVLQHDGSPLTASTAAEALRPLVPSSWNVSSSGWTLTVVADRAVASLFATADPLFRCGPFERVGASLKAFDLYWDRRAYIDAIETVSAAQEADIAELPLAGARRPRVDTHRLWSTSPVETFVIEAANPSLREALSLAIDRQSIVKVMFQGRGEAAGSLLPQWMSGYAFVFNVQQDLARARGLLKTSGTTMVLGYAPGDAMAKQLADRVAVNARDAGLILQTKSGRAGELYLRREALTPYPSIEAERAALEKLVPVVHVPRLYAIHSRVRGWEAAHDGKSVEFHPESIWLDS